MDKRLDRYCQQFLLLRQLRESGNAAGVGHSYDIVLTGRKAGLDENMALDAFVELVHQEACEFTGFLRGAITDVGISELDEALSGKRSGLFPARIEQLAEGWKLERHRAGR